MGKSPRSWLYQIPSEGLLMCLRPLLEGCCSWHQCQVKQSQVTFSSSGVSAVLGLMVNHIWESSKNIPKHLITWFPVNSQIGSRGSCCPVCPQAVPVQGWAGSCLASTPLKKGNAQMHAVYAAYVKCFPFVVAHKPFCPGQGPALSPLSKAGLWGSVLADAPLAHSCCSNHHS